MANEVVIHVRGDTAQAEQATTSLVEKLKGSAQHLRGLGIAMTAMGGTITAIAGLAVKSALEEEISIKRLDAALRRVGESYGENKRAIEDVISALQSKSNYSDSEQRMALEKLISLTGDYTGALNMLPVVLDLAAGLQMDLQSASLLVAKAMEGETDSLSRYGLKLAEGAGPTEIMAALMEKFGGSAAAAADPVTILKNQVSDLMEDMGAILLPILTDVLGTIGNLVEGMRRWMEAHPGLTRAIVLIGSALGVLMVTLGAFLLLLPTIIGAMGALGAAFTVATGPIGLIVAALAVLGIGVGIAISKLSGMKRTTMETAGATRELGDRLVEIGPKTEGVAKAMSNTERQLKKTAEAMKEAVKAAEEIVAAARFAETGAGTLGITIEQIAQAFLRLGGDSKVLVAALAATASATDKVNALLNTLGMSSIEVANALGRASQAQTEWIDNEKEMVQAAEDYIKAQVQLAQGFDSIVAASQFALTTAGELGLTVDKVGVAFLKLGGDSAVLRAALSDTASAQDKVTALLAALGLTTMEAANAVGIFSEAQQEAMRFMEDYERQQNALIESTERIIASSLYAITTAGELGLSVENVAEAFRRLGGDSVTLQNALIDTAGASDKVNALLSALGISAEQAANAVGILTEAQKAAAKEADNLRRENERLENQWKSLQERAASYLAQIGYTLSAAGKLRISTQDVGAAFLATGGSVDRLRAAFIAAQGQGDEVNAMLKALGLSAQQVADAIDRLNQKASSLLQSSPLQASRLAALQVAGTIVQTPESRAAIHALGQAYQYNWTVEQQREAERRLRAGETLKGLPGFAKGGIITQPTLALLGERGPEAVVPLNQTAAMSIKVTITNHGIIGVQDLDSHIVQTIRDAKRRGAFEGVIA